jgi:putative transposase
MPRLRHFDNLGTTRFITFSCYRRQKLLQSRETILEVLASIEIGRIQFGFAVLGYVIMPTHVHLVLHPRKNLRIGSVIGAIKRQSGFRIISKLKKQGSGVISELTDLSIRKQNYAFWQPRCYDHNCRTPETVREKIIYCHNNPLCGGLVTDPGDWEWSSYRWYMGDKRGVVQIEEFEI